MSVKQILKNLCPPFLWVLLKWLIPPVFLLIARRIIKNRKDSSVICPETLPDPVIEVPCPSRGEEIPQPQYRCPVCGKDVLEFLILPSYYNLLKNHCLESSKEELNVLIRKSLSNNMLAVDVYDSLQDDESRSMYAWLYLRNIIKSDGRSLGILQTRNIISILSNRLIEKGKDLSAYDLYDTKFFFGKQYFYLQNEEWIKTTENEIFLDCGAFNGKTIKDFVEFCGGKYNKIYSFEPIPSQYENTLKNINEAGIERVELLQKGVWSCKSSFNFSDNSSSSMIDNAGMIPVEVVSIDEIIPENENVTFIKMDIEGAEFEALNGAINTIRRCKPKLAICIYHKPQDIIEIPMLIKSILPEYKFYIRHHSSIQEWETVLSALPSRKTGV